MSLHHGEIDPYTPTGSTLVYRKLRKMGVPAELHLYPDKGHGAFGFERGVEFMTQMGFLGPVQPEVALADRFTSDEARSQYIKEDIWPEGSPGHALHRMAFPERTEDHGHPDHLFRRRLCAQRPR